MAEGPLAGGYYNIPVQDGGGLDVGNRTVLKWVDTRHIGKVVSKGHGG